MSVGTFTRYPYTGPEDQLVDVFVQGPWSTGRETRTLAHPLLEDSHTNYTLRAPAPRAGTMTLRLPDAVQANAAADFFSRPAEYDLYPINPEVCSARFVVIGGQISIEQGPARSWTVSIPWSEVTP